MSVFAIFSKSFNRDHLIPSISHLVGRKVDWKMKIGFNESCDYAMYIM